MEVAFLETLKMVEILSAENTQKSYIIYLIDLISGSSFRERSKKSPTDFVRNRKLDFATLIGMILRMVKTSIQIACNFIGDLMKTEPASKQAFSQARNRLLPSAFQEMFLRGVLLFYTKNPERGLWRGYRLIGCDGSTGRLPKSPELEEHFGCYPGKSKSPVMGRISEFRDITTKLIISGRMAPYAVSEEVLAAEQLEEIVPCLKRLGQEKPLFIYDRGYPSEAFIDQHIRLGADFLFRLPKNFNKAVMEIREMEEREGFIIREGWPPLRVVKVPLSTGETELLLTGLIEEEFTTEDLSEVYHSRWAAMEEGYKREKIVMQLENFSGKTVVAVEQEYWANLIVNNILEMGCVDIEGGWVPGALPEKHVNRSVLFGSMRDATLEVICGGIDPEDYRVKFERVAMRNMLKRKPNRNYSREDVGKPKNHHVYRRSC
jgi:hypothetical protein